MQKLSRKARSTKLSKLLTRLKRSPMTHKQVVKFLLKDVCSYDSTTRKYFDNSLYSSSTKVGFFEKFAYKNADGLWAVRKNRKAVSPFTSTRTDW